MDAHYNGSNLIDLNKNNKMSNKVYINPNFNKKLNNHNLPERGAHTHINPKFSNAVRSVDYKQTTVSTKIYINPSFIKTTNNPKTSVGETPIIYNDLVNNISNNENFENNYTKDFNTNNTLLTTVQNSSRYSLVRFNKMECANVTVAKKPTNTIKISKYKLVPLNNMKNIIANTKCSTNSNLKNFNGSPLIQKQNIVRPTVINVSRNRHKFIKHKPSSAVRLVANRCIDNIVSREAIKKTNATLKIKIRKVMKKNNIPCPLFKKFGKCIRLEHGHCEFLHDKKHLSICRKFLKGVCHDRDCLLSHDLTVKKMPTCYFYLKGMCNKTDCPYLHVKLSEKSKVCPDFLKGYCEKGKKCLNRHVNISFDRASAKNLHTNKRTCTKKYNKESVNCKIKNKYDANKEKTKEIKETVDSKGHTTEHRYYQDLDDGATTDKGICEVIQPSRCKLGALPSFIQL